MKRDNLALRCTRCDGKSSSFPSTAGVKLEIIAASGD